MCPKNSSRILEFSYQKNNRALPNVLIYGDSISIHYHEELREKLAGKANLYRIPWNGEDSSTLIPKMERLRFATQDYRLKDRWDFDWDVIQFNVGLHDLKYLDGDRMDKATGKQVSSLESYEKNLHRIVLYFRKIAPGAKLIFATTTPVPEGEAGRVAGDAPRFNEIAAKVMKEYPETIINDLYALTKPNQPNWWTKPGNVHFNAMGQEAQAEQTAGIIRKAFAE